MKRVFYIVLCALSLCPLWGQELLDYPLDTINGVEVYRYEVEKSVGLYRISVNFNVTQEDIIRLNPQLRERGLHYGETIFLPTGRKVEKNPVKTDDKLSKVKEMRDHSAVQVVLPEQPKARMDSLVTKRSESPDGPQESGIIVLRSDTTIIGSLAGDSTMLDSLATDSLAIDSLVDHRPFVELALMLPFESLQTKRSANADRMLEFYQGVLFALHDLREDSVRYRLRVYDTERSERRIMELCDSTELDSVRGILGLVYPIQIERMANWCYVHEVPLVLPFSDDADLKENRYMLQFNSTDQQEADSLCEWIGAHDVHCVAIESRDAEVSSFIRTLRNTLKRREIGCTTLALRDLMSDSASYALSREKENLIILHSDRFQHVRILMSHLALLQEAGYKIRIVSQYSWQKENISLPQVYTSIFTAESDRERYDAQWQLFFGREHVSEVPRYDLLGYDLMKALLNYINGKTDSYGLQSTIHWQQVENGGWQNGCLKVKIER